MTLAARVGIAVSLSLFVMSGCGQETASITGKVTYQGKPLPAGRIAFICQGEGTPVLTAQIVDGAYTIENAVPGPAKVTVVTFENNTVAVPGGEGTAPPRAEGEPAPAETAGGEYVPIPREYAMPDTTPLSYEITAGAQTKDFELAP